METSLLSHARSMRRQPTPAEHKLWQAIRTKQVRGQRWRRQAPLGPYIVDFLCPHLRLVIEVDGATRAEPAGDERRTVWLRAQGLVVLRFWDNEVLGNLPGVLERIAAYPSPNPLPQGEVTASAGMTECSSKEETQ